MIKYLLPSWFATLISASAAYADQSVTFGMTTTQEASGISRAILEGLQQEFSELDISYSVAGTSQQLRSVEEGFIPFAITHNAHKEIQLIEGGNHLREELFANDFLLVGPDDYDLECQKIFECLEQIADEGKPFLSRGDQSGTNIYELSVWDDINVDPLVLPSYMWASGGAANSLRICAVQDCFLIIDESSFANLNPQGLIEVARDIGANVYSFVYAVEFAESQHAPIIEWLTAEVPVLSEQFGYSGK